MSTIWDSFLSLRETISIIDIIDVLAVAFIIYYGVRLVRETRAMQLVKSIGVIFVVYFIAKAFHMITLEFFLQTVLDVGIIVLVVLFQPEIRRALERIGRSRLVDLGRFGLGGMKKDETQRLIEILKQSCEDIIKRGDGAIIVIERDIRLGDIVNTGTSIDAEPSVPLLGNIFYTNSPLHDGATIIRSGRVLAAGCYLPLSETDQLDRSMGTRHRAALGVSEISDSITLVVSEERKEISLAQEAQITTGLTPAAMAKELEKRLLTPEAEEKEGAFATRGDKNEKD